MAEIPTFVGEVATVLARTTSVGGPTTTRRLRRAQTVLADGQRSLLCPLRRDRLPPSPPSRTLCLVLLTPPFFLHGGKGTGKVRWVLLTAMRSEPEVCGRAHAPATFSPPGSSVCGPFSDTSSYFAAFGADLGIAVHPTGFFCSLLRCGDDVCYGAFGPVLCVCVCRLAPWGVLNCTVLVYDCRRKLLY